MTYIDCVALDRIHVQLADETAALLSDKRIELYQKESRILSKSDRLRQVKRERDCLYNSKRHDAALVLTKHFFHIQCASALRELASPLELCKDGLSTKSRRFYWQANELGSR